MSACKCVFIQQCHPSNLSPLSTHSPDPRRLLSVHTFSEVCTAVRTCHLAPSILNHNPSTYIRKDLLPCCSLSSPMCFDRIRVQRYRRTMHSTNKSHNNTPTRIVLYTLYSHAPPVQPVLAQCSVSCGTGIQTRSIDCVDTFGALSTSCIANKKPLMLQACSSGVPCPAITVAVTRQPLDADASAASTAAVTRSSAPPKAEKCITEVK